MTNTGPWPCASPAEWSLPPRSGTSRHRYLRSRWLIIGALAAGLLAVLSVVLFTAGNQPTVDPPALAGDLYRVDAETLHLQCQGNGSPTVVLLGGRGSSTTSWTDFRQRLGATFAPAHGTTRGSAGPPESP